jgi:hypothetical protein
MHSCSAKIINSHTGFKQARAILDQSSLDFATTLKRDIRSWPGRHQFVVFVHAELFKFYHKTVLFSTRFKSSYSSLSEVSL